MAGRSKKTDTTDEKLQNLSTETETELLETDDEALMNVLTDLSGDEEGGKVNVYRQKGDNSKKLTYLFSCAPEEFTLETLRDEYGAGDFRVQVRKGGLLLANKLISVEAPKNSDQNTNKNFNPNDMLSIVQHSIAQNNEKIFEMMLKLADRQSGVAAIDPMQMQSSMIQNMVMMKELIGGKQSSESPEKMLELFFKGMEFAKGTISETGEPSGMGLVMEAIKTFGKPIAEMTTAMSKQQGMIPQALPVPMSNPIPTPVTPKKSAFETYIPYLFDKATNGKNPETYAEMLVDEIQHADLIPIIQQPDFIEHCSKSINQPFNDEIKEWFAELQTIVLEFYEEEQKEDLQLNNQMAEGVEEMKQFVSELVNEAINNTDIKTSAEKVVIKFSDPIAKGQLRQLIERPDVIELLNTFDTRVITYREWFERLLGEVKNMLDK